MNKQQKRVVEVFSLGLSLAMLGFVLFFSGAAILFEISLFLTIIGAIIVVVSMPKLMRFMDLDIKKRRNKGIIWIWAIALVTIVVMAFAWFALTWPVALMYEVLVNTYGVPSEVAYATSLLMNVIAWFLVFMLFGILLWAYVNSQRREDVTYGL